MLSNFLGLLFLVSVILITLYFVYRKHKRIVKVVPDTLQAALLKKQIAEGGYTVNVPAIVVMDGKGERW